MKGWLMTEPGPPDSLALVDLPDPEPRREWVLINVKAFGLNRSELYTRQGHSGDAVTLPRVLGIECVGTVADAGGTDLEVGQTVAAAMGGMGRTHHGGYATKTLIPQDNVYPIETTLDWTTLGALPETYLTAWGALIDACGLQSDHTVLIRGGTSSVGMAAISIANHLGATVIATTRNPDKTSALHEAGAHHTVIDEGAVADRVRQLVPGGVDRAVELVGRLATIEDSLLAMRPRGVLSLVGFLGDEWDYGLPWPPSTVRLTMYSSDTLTTATATPVLQSIVDRVAAGSYRANIHEALDFGDVPRGHTIMESNLATGKLVVRTP
jgi:NADPH:quinone reductase-like Zn-dependent oxidoreductase